MAESRLISNGGTTVPAEARKALGAKPDTRLVWHVMLDGNDPATRSEFSTYEAFYPARNTGFLAIGRETELAEP